MAADPHNEGSVLKDSDPFIASLLKSPTGNPSSGGEVPIAQKSKSGGAQSSGATESPTWDAVLMAIDWKQTDRRQYELLNEIPWRKLSDQTINHLAYEWLAYDQAHHPEVANPHYNQASEEQTRRFSAGEENKNAKAQTADIMRLFTEDPAGLTRGEDVLLAEDANPNNPNNNKNAANETNPDEDDEMSYAPDEFYTIGFELELFVAVTTADGAEDPHKDGRWLDLDLTHDAPASIKFRDRVMRAVSDHLNADAAVICTVKDEDEGNPVYRVAQEQLDTLGAAGGDQDDKQLADPGAVARAAATAVAHAQTVMYDASENRRLHQATPVDIDRYVERLSDSPALAALAPGDLDEAARRVRRRLRVLVHQAQRDPLHVDLPGMKHRYRAWSVSPAADLRPDGVRTAQYALAPGPRAPPPVAGYKWAALKVASPAMSGHETARIEQALERVCRTLRARFRAHLDLPASLPLSTQVSVSHTQGFSLLELKKVATLVRLLEAPLRRLHRVERTAPDAWRACGSFATWTALGSAAGYSPHWLFANPKAPAWRALPRPAPATRVFLESLMEQHLPTADMFALGQEDEVFYRGLWLYASVEQLSRGLASVSPGIRPAVVFKCAGRGQHTAADRDEVDDEQRPLPFLEVDRQRGVVEFRHMQQSLDHFHVLSWGAVCARIVAVAKDTQPAEFHSLLLEILRGDRYIAEVLGVPDRFIEGFKQGMARGDDGFFQHPDKGVIDYGQPFWKPM
ncbi:hypothetical protein F4775DRAFT_600741 [Biscogniauxia sp. FL1348]|nr:hypothetical protein F4775DRAFT_600741 [Biscogniauxia sp. FL1348]